MRSPRVVIGLPVYNGQNYLRHAIETILAQTYTDFQLLISDNASTDTTEEICREYAKQDSRIVYHRQQHNIGGGPNYNFVFQASDADYFKWQAHDDTLEPDYLRQCVELLDQDDSLAIAHSRSLVINETGQCIGTYDGEIRLNGATPSERFWKILWAGYFTEVFGLMRSQMVKRTHLQRSFAGSDRNFVADMLLQGNVGYIEQYLFSRRDHAECYCKLKDTATKLEWFDPKVKRSMSKFTGLVKTKTYLDAIATFPMSPIERARCVQKLVEWSLRRGIESVTGSGEQFGDRFRQEFAASRQWESDLDMKRVVLNTPGDFTPVGSMLSETKS